MVMSASRREATSETNLRRFESAESWRIRLSGRGVNNIKGVRIHGAGQDVYLVTTGKQILRRVPRDSA